MEILKVLPVESEKMNEAGNILMMDILVKTKAGMLIDVEMQRLPYMFNGKRVSCYLADLIMRQYNRIRAQVLEEENGNFTYGRMKPVYCLILFEQSGKNIKKLPYTWEDKGKIVFDTGLEEEFLENIHYIELDKFRKNVRNISSDKEMWIALLSADSPERVQEIAAYSEEMFEIISEAAEYSCNVEGVLEMFSEVLRILDRNTEKYMIDEAMKAIEQKDKALEENKKEIEEKDKALEEIKYKKDREIEDLKRQIEKLKKG